MRDGLAPEIVKDVSNVPFSHVSDVELITAKQ